MTRTGFIVIVVVLGALTAACEASDPPPRWGYIHAAIIQPNCTTAGCHSSITAIAGLPLAGADEAYNVLTGRVCGEPYNPAIPPHNYVEPFVPEGSLLIHRLRGERIAIMPPDRPLPEREIELVYRWIEDGAACD